MNIFYLDEDPNLCATYHGDKHVVKMILETAQMMSTAHRVLDGTMVREEVNGRMLKRWNHPDQKLQELLYKATHVNHPSCQWIRASKQNYEWATKFLVALCVQYFDRYGKVHKADREGLIYELCELPNNIEEIISYAGNVAGSFTN